VPNFRLRLDNEGAVIASNSYGYAMTGRSSPPQEPLYGMLNNSDFEARVGPTLRPSSNPLKPSLYRVDFAAMPASMGSRLGATFESFSTEDPANGTLSLTELDLAGYYSSNFGTTTLIYAPDFYINGGTSSPFVTINSGAFNAENDFRAGRRQALDISGEVPDSQLSQIIDPHNATGVIMDTAQVPDDKFGIALLNTGSIDQTQTPRLMPSKLYEANFFIGSDLDSTTHTAGVRVQSGIQFQIQTAGGAVTSRCELAGPATFASPDSNTRYILSQVLPGVLVSNTLGGAFPRHPGEGVGTYAVVLSTPLDPDLRQDAAGELGPLANEPGPGVDAPSLRDISIGITVVTQPTSLRLSDDLVIPWAPPNRTKIRIYGMELSELPQVDDDGYAY
jgi:hypothetical protein